MSQGSDPAAAARSRFDQVMRGYDKRQVDQHVQKTDSDLAALTAEHRRLRAQLQSATGQLQQAKAELAAMNHRPREVERASFRDLGPLVDQILGLAETQANQITSSAT